MNNSTIKSFSTSFGHEITLVPGYRDGKPPIYNPDSMSNSQNPPPEGDFGIFSDIFQFTMFVNWLDSINISTQQHRNLLDVGGNTGLIASLFKATNRAETVTSLDKYDYSRSLSSNRVLEVLSDLHNAKTDILISSHSKKELHPRTTSILGFFQSCSELYCTPTPNSIWAYPWKLYRQSLLESIAANGRLGLDYYLQEDFYTHQEKYDCITCFSAFEFFSPVDFLIKVNSLLRPGGFLYLWHINWYWVLTATGIFGDFPYAAQRLTRHDLGRYFDKFYPQEKEKVFKSYDSWHLGDPHHTLGDYISMAVDVGLLPVNVHRLVPLNGEIPNNIVNWKLGNNHNTDCLKSVLRDINCFKQSITMIDLLTQSFFMVFRKP